MSARLPSHRAPLLTILLLPLLSFLIIPTYGQGTYDNNGVETQGTTLEINIPAGNDRILAVHGMASFDISLFQASFDGTPMNLVVSSISLAGYSSWHILALGSGGPVTGTVDYTSLSPGEQHIWAGSFHNVDQIQPILDYGSSFGEGTVATVDNLLARGPNDILLDGIVVGTVFHSVSADDGIRVLDAELDNGFKQVCTRYRQCVAVGRESMSWTATGSIHYTQTAIVLAGLLGPVPPFSKVFSPATIGEGGISTLEFTINNTNNALDATALGFTDNLPAGVVVATTPNASATCTGGTLTAVAGSGSISYTGGMVPAGDTCTVSVDVTAAITGSYINTSGVLTSSYGSNGIATDTLTVVAPSSIHGIIYQDGDTSGTYAPTGIDLPLAFAVINLSGTDGSGYPVDLSTTSDANGEFWFTGLVGGAASSFNITVAASGFSPTTSLDYMTSLLVGECQVALAGQAMLSGQQQFETVIGAPLQFGFIPVVASDCNPNCHDVNASLNAAGRVVLTLSDFLANDLACGNGVAVSIKTSYDAIVYGPAIVTAVDQITFNACNYKTQTLKIQVSTPSGTCWSTLTFKQSDGPIFIPRFSAHVFCNHPLVEGGDILDVKPLGFIPCDGIIEGQFVTDWIIPFPCESDTAKVILREYEAFDKLGRRGSIVDTITVSKLPQIIPIPLGTDLRNLSCVDQDTLYCGENDLTDEDGITPVGPYLLVEEFPDNPVLDIDGDLVNCDTIYFCGYRDGEFLDLFSGTGTKCGLEIHKDVQTFGDVCNRQYKVTLEIKQDCYKTPVMLDCTPVGSGNIQILGNGYYRCEFWLTDLDTTAPTIVPKVFTEFPCITISADIFSGGANSFLDIFQPVISTSDHACEAHTYLPPLCVFDDWSGVKAVKAIVEGGGTYLLENSGEECVLIQFAGESIAVSDLEALAGDLEEIVIFTGDLSEFLDTGYCYRSSQLVKIPKTDQPTRIFYEAYDSCHVIARDTAYIVIKDDEKPVVVVDKGLTVSLSDKKVWVNAQSFDEGSWDNCGVNMILARRADWTEACVDLCHNAPDSVCEDKENALCWLWTDGHDTLWTLDLEEDKHCDEVEAHYQKQLDWFCSDDLECGSLLYNSWQYDLIKYATTQCKGADYYNEDFDNLFERAVGDPQNGDQVRIKNQDLLNLFDTLLGGIIKESLLMDDNVITIGDDFFGFWVDVFKCQELSTIFCNGFTEEDFESLLLQLFGCVPFLAPGVELFPIPIFPPSTRRALFDEWKAIGGGWSDQVVFSCEDACGPVTVEILVMDYWCNWAKGWTNVWVEDKTPVQVVKDVVDEETITCKTYKDKRYAYPDEIHPVSLDYVVEQAKVGEQDAFDLLDEVFGGYEKAWRDPYGNYVDNEGTELDCDITFYDSICKCTRYKDQVRVYDDHLGYIWKDSFITECFYYQDTIDLQQGVVVVNCEENVYCEQEVWCEFDHCGQGFIFRKFKIWQGCPDSFYLEHNVPDSLRHGTDTIYRHQRIWVGNECELDKYMFDVPEDAVVYSCNIEYDGGANVVGDAGPENTGYATYKFDDDCRIVGIGHSDKVFKVVGGDEACYKILRTWYFADWCGTGEPVSGNWWDDYELVIDSCVQKIIVNDSTPPVCTITGLVESGGAIEVGACAFNLDVSVTASDLCGLTRYYWELKDITDPDAATVVDDGSGSLSGEAEESFGITSDDLPHANYKLKVVTVDECNNEGYCEYFFDVVSVKKPSPVCITNLTARLTPWDSDGDGVVDSAHAVVWAGEFDSSSEPACQDTAIEFRIEFVTGDSTDNDAAGDADSLALGCADFGTHLVRLWVVSLPSDTRDFCDVVLIVQSDFSGCDTNEPGEREPLREVEGMTESTKAMDRSMLTSDQGKQPGIGGRPLGQTVGVEGYVLQQNVPNPFQAETNIGFVLPEPMQASVTVYDVTGRVIRAIEGSYVKGYNQIQFRNSDLGVSGILYYRLNTGTYSATRKMVLIE